MNPVDVADEPNHHLVFENEHVRVFNAEIPAYSSTLLHRHGHDYSVVILGAADVEDEAMGEPPHRKSYQGGETSSGRAGFTHTVRNLGATPFRNIVVELKR
jgi:hypothetical protein